MKKRENREIRLVKRRYKQYYEGLTSNCDHEFTEWSHNLGEPYITSRGDCLKFRNCPKCGKAESKLFKN